MTLLFNRVWRATIGTLRVSAPTRIAFEIERTLRPSPNPATLKLWNLTRDHQAAIEGAEDEQVVIEAGYEERGLEQLFRGTLFRGRGDDRDELRSVRDGVDIVTTVEARDGGREYQEARVEQGFGPGVAVTTVVRACVEALGVGSGNVADVVGAATFIGGGNTYPEGTVLSGQASRELTRVLGSLGLRWSVQHGAIQVMRVGRALQTQAVRLAASTGLVGAPEVGTRGRVRARSLLNASLWPGRRVQLESERVRGLYEVRSVKYLGDSDAQDWYADCDLAPEGVAA